MAFSDATPRFWWLPSSDEREPHDARAAERLNAVREDQIEAEIARRDPNGWGLIPRVKELLEAVKNASTDQQLLDIASRFEREAAARKSALVAKHFPNGFEPLIENERMFMAVLGELDADYLISHLPEVVRAELDSLIAEWLDYSAGVVARAFWPGGRFDKERLRSILPQTVVAVTPEEHFKDIASNALRSFCEGRRRVVRWAIETAQRRMLANRNPVFAVAETDSEIRRSWCSYVGRCAKQELNLCRGQEQAGMRDFPAEFDDAEDRLQEYDDAEIGPQGRWDE